MTVLDANVTAGGEKIIARAREERRRFRRVRIAAAGRLYIVATGEEAICTIEDISPGDASILCQLKQEPHDRAGSVPGRAGAL